MDEVGTGPLITQLFIGSVVIAATVVGITNLGPSCIYFPIQNSLKI